jgi:predicted TIM-barrel fold metal-dependent hydrolase
MPLPAIDDEAGAVLDSGLPPVFDAHTHVFPERLFRAIWRWFDEHGWPIREKLLADDVIAAQRRRGHVGCLLLHYAHRPGIARDMNRFVSALANDSGGFAVGAATVCPGEDGAADIVAEAISMGLRAIKLHCHVQGCAIDDPRLDDVYEVAAAAGVPVVVHAGREPWSAALPKDPYTTCHISRTEAVLARHQRLTLVIPHLGADEFADYRRVQLRCDRLWLDTTMMVADYFPGLFDHERDVVGDDGVAPWLPFIQACPERVLYGSDAPNLPYAWDREVKALARHLDEQHLEGILSGNARRLLHLSW